MGFLTTKGKVFKKNCRTRGGEDNRKGLSSKGVHGFWLVLNHQTNIALSTQYELIIHGQKIDRMVWKCPILQLLNKYLNAHIVKNY